MTRLIIETSLLLLAAYFLGAWLACLVRRTFFAGTARTEFEPVVQAASPAMASAATAGIVAPPNRRPDPKPIALETIERSRPQATADAANRFEKVLTEPPVPASQPAKPTAPVPATAAPAASRPVSPEPAPAMHGAGAIAQAAAAASVASLVIPVVAAPSVPQRPAAPTGQPSVAAPIPAEPDDLTRIRAIDPSLQAGLRSLGVQRFQDIASWLPADVSRISKALGFAGRIEQENWIEQAQILARGGETAYARRKALGESETLAPAEGNDRKSSPLPPAALVAPVVANAAAAATISSAPASSPRVEDRAAFAQPAPAVRVQAPAVAIVPAPAAPDPTVPSPGLAAAAASAAAAAAGQAATVSSERDVLQRIGGINAEVEKLLNAQGVSRYSQIAGWSADDAMRIDRMLGSEGRVRRENWIEQAQMLARGGNTAFSRQFDQRAAGVSDTPRPPRLADAIRDTATKSGADGGTRASDMSGLRSVRSEAYASSVAKSAQSDDLKRIRGVGVLIEKKLFSMGVTTYEQIANWSAADVDRVSQVLDFRGRIERENWVEQARILSAGGQTEFSRRVDRGDPGSSRNR